MRWPFVKRSRYDEVCKAAREHNQRANHAEYAEGAMKKLGLNWKRRAELAEAKNEQLIAALVRYVAAAAPPIAVPAGAIPDPPSVSANDKNVAVALRDREAAPLKRPLRPGEEE